jgi:hypothetical protein
MVDDHPVEYCHWARKGLCDWPPPIPPSRCVPWEPPRRTQAIGPTLLDLRTRERPPFRPPVDQDEAIAWMVKLHGEGQSLAAIARTLDCLGFLPPMRGTRGGQWNGVTVRRYLAWARGETEPRWWRPR